MTTSTETANERATTALWWIKRDIRVHDNAALSDAVCSCDNLISLFVLEPEVLLAEDASYMHLIAQLQALACLKRSLNERGADLWIARGDIVEVLRQLKYSTGFCSLFSHQETGSQATYQRDKKVSRWCRENQVQWHEKKQNGVVRGPHDRAARSQAIAGRLLSREPLTAPETIRQCRKPAPAVITTRIPDACSLPSEIKHINSQNDLQLTQLQKVSESHARADLQSFLDHRGLGYAGGISSPNLAFTHGSRLSAHLAWGTISLCTVFSETSRKLTAHSDSNNQDNSQWQRSLRAFQSRLFWHDHFIQRLESVPDMELQALNPSYRQLDYPNDAALLEAWTTGHTGLPLVDACMGCLRSSGFLNFRMRAMLTSVACFGLGLSWKKIQYPLARVFLDYEPGIHLSQIQMQAAIVGINTIRVYNPLKQLLEQDPECRFTKRWIPELAEFSPEEIACYNTRTLGSYVPPACDIEANSRYLKDQIFRIRKSPEGIESAKQILREHGSAKRAKRKPVVSRRNKSATDSPQLSLDFQ